MTSQGVEALNAAIRRSFPLIVGFVLVGIVAVNLFQQIRGPQYEASAQVLTSSTPLSSIITGTQPAFVDAERLQETAVGIAESQEVYEVAARQTDGQFGDADELRAATSVAAEESSDLISFTASDPEREVAIGAVNAVAEGYIDFRSRLSSSQIEKTIESLRTSLESLPAEGTRGGERLQNQLNKLLILQENSADTQLVDSATSADKTSPAPLRDSLIGFSIGLIVALLVAALREAIDTRVRSEGDVEDLLATPVLATVRTLPRRTRMVTYGRHQAAFADSYALLAAQLVKPTQGLDGTVLAVTSAVSREGKTTTAANLAVSAARRGATVVLADFDFRKPAQSDLFGIPEDAPGALRVMSGRASLDDVLWSVSLEGTYPQVSKNGSGPSTDALQGGEFGAVATTGSLHILPAGGETRSAPQQSRMRSLLRDLRLGVDLVILDTPPALLTVEVAELSKLIDTIVVVVRQGKVTQRNLRALRRQAQGWTAEMAGAVMTDAQAEGTKYSYYGER